MTPIFKVGHTFRSPFVGNPDLMAMEEAGIEAPQVEAAMRAATVVLGSVGGSNMGGVGCSEADKIVCATARSVLNHTHDIGPAKLIRFGLFVDEYRRFRNTLAMKEVVDQIVAQEKIKYDKRAAEWAGEIHDAIQESSARKAEAAVPWRKLLMFTGLGALVIAIFKVLFGDRTRQTSDMVITPDMIMPSASAPPPPTRLALQEKQQHSEESDSEEGAVG